jgi:hypothetical protein
VRGRSGEESKFRLSSAGVLLDLLPQHEVLLVERPAGVFTAGVEGSGTVLFRAEELADSLVVGAVVGGHLLLPPAALPRQVPQH